LKDLRPHSFFTRARPYLIIAVAGILAFAPISFFIGALKNDVIAIEYPINYFMSQCIHHGKDPSWFNTWGMGFPLQSALTWSIFSPPRIFFSALFDYNIYTLHIEWMCYVLLAGFTMYRLLIYHFISNQRLATLLAITYMLSGFIVGSSQWMLYLTGAAFAPLVIAALLDLLKIPSWRGVLKLAVFSFVQLTSVYPAFTIILAYSLLIFLLIYFIPLKAENRKALRYLVYSAVFTLLVCAPVLYYTLELISYLERGAGISSSLFFSSNYVPPSSLSNLLLPLASVRMTYANTEATMFHNYLGLFILITFPLVIYRILKKRDMATILLILSSFFFLFLSFGDATPLRQGMNILPGFSFFRNPGIFRFFFTICIILSTARSLRDMSWQDLLNGSAQKILRYVILLLTAACIFTLCFTCKNLFQINFKSPALLLRTFTLDQALALSACFQLGVLIAVLAFVKLRLAGLVWLVLVGELVFATLICTPFFTVSSYSLKEVNTLLSSTKNFPVQQSRVNRVPAVFRDKKMNPWDNVNVFSKQISSQDSYKGPLVLREYLGYRQLTDSGNQYFNQLPVFAGINRPLQQAVTVVDQYPAGVVAQTNFQIADTLTLLQNHYPGWHVFINGKETPLLQINRPGLHVVVPGLQQEIIFRYKRLFALLWAGFLHWFVLLFLVHSGWRFFTQKNKSL